MATSSAETSNFTAIPDSVLGAIKGATFDRALKLTLEGQLSRTDWNSLVVGLINVNEVKISDEDRVAIENIKRSTVRDVQLRLLVARMAAGRLLEPNVTDVRRINIRGYWETLPRGLSDEDREAMMTREFVAAIETYADADERSLDRYTAMSEMHTVDAQARMFDRGVDSILRMMKLSPAEINRADQSTWKPFSEIRLRMCDAMMGSQIDPKGFPKGVGYVLTKSEKTRIFVPDGVRIYPEAQQRLTQTFDALRPATDASKDAAEGAMRAMLTGKDMRSVVSSYWEPYILEAEDFEEVAGGLWITKNVKEKPVRMSTQEGMDFWSGNQVEYKEKEQDVPYLKAEEDVMLGGVTLVAKGGEFCLDDDSLQELVGKYLNREYGTIPEGSKIKARSNIRVGDNVIIRSGEEFDLSDLRIAVALRERVLKREIQTSMVMAEALPNPKSPIMIVPGEWLYTIDDIFREMDGQNPLADFYLKSHGINPERVVGHRTKSGFTLEDTSVLNWNDELLLGVKPEKRSTLVGSDLLSIKASEFHNNGIRLFGVTQMDAFLDPACRKKQHLETSMRSIIPDEYIWRHAITDIDSRDTTMSVFGTLLGRKLRLNAYIYSLYQGLGYAQKGVSVPNFNDTKKWPEPNITEELEGAKRIDDMTDPYQLGGKKNFLGIIDFGADAMGKPDILDERRRILEHYAISRREYAGQHHDIEEINRLYYESHYIALQVKNNQLTMHEGRAKLEELRKDVLRVKRSDYMTKTKSGEGYYWDMRAPFEHPRPAIEQVPMLGAMGSGEATSIRPVSHKDLIISLGGKKDMPDWHYEGWYGKAISLKYANSTGFFFWGEDIKQEQMQLKYMSVAGQAFGIALDATKASIQSLNPEVLKQAGMDVDPRNWGDDLGEKVGLDIVNKILNEGFNISGKEPLRHYFDKIAEVLLGKAGALNHLPGEAQKKTMLMFLDNLQSIVEGGVSHHYRKKMGLGSPGTEGVLLNLDFKDPTFGWVDQWLAGAYRERGDEVVFVHGEKPYVSAQGHKVVYLWEGAIDPNTGKWVANDTKYLPYRERYNARKLEMFSTNIFGRVGEEYLRDNSTFDVADREWMMQRLRAKMQQKTTEYRDLCAEIEAKGLNVKDFEVYSN